MLPPPDEDPPEDPPPPDDDPPEDPPLPPDDEPPEDPLLPLKEPLLLDVVPSGSSASFSFDGGPPNEFPQPGALAAPTKAITAATKTLSVQSCLFIAASRRTRISSGSTGHASMMRSIRTCAWCR